MSSSGERLQITVISTGDEELDCINLCLQALGKLEPMERSLVIEYLAKRNVQMTWPLGIEVPQDD